MLLAALTLPAVTQAAGDFHVYAGALPDGTPLAVGPWTGLSENPGGVGTAGLTMPGASRQGWSQQAGLAAPANLSFAAADAQRRYSLPVGANHSQPQATTTWENVGHPYTGRNPIYGGYDGVSASGPASVARPTALTIRLACVDFDGVAGDCAQSYYWLDRLDLTLHDDEAPIVSGTMDGPLLNGSWQTATAAQLNVTASDLGSGVYRAFLREGAQTYYALVDSASIRCRDARPGTPYAYDFAASTLTLVPCATASRTYTPSFDLTQLGDGTHVVSVGIEDAGGNERTVLTNRTLKVNTPGGALGDPGTACTGGAYDEAGVCHAATSNDNNGGGGDPPTGSSGASGGVTPVNAPSAPAPIVSPVVAPPAIVVAERRANGDGASTDASLTLRVNGQATRHVTLDYGQQLVVSGRLAGRGDTPIAGATIAVRALRGRTSNDLAPVVTAADGSFRAVIAAGTSRTIHFAYRAFADDGDDADSADLEIGVRTGAHLKVGPRELRNGQAVRFRGRVDDPPAGSTKVVEMQVHQDGRWLTFATTRLHKGHFTYRYRFTRTTATTRYVFRTIVRTEGGWPYETGTSNHVSVQVRP